MSVAPQMILKSHRVSGPGQRCEVADPTGHIHVLGTGRHSLPRSSMLREIRRLRRDICLSHPA